MKVLFNRRKVKQNTVKFLTKYSIVRKKLLMYNYHRKCYDIIKNKFVLNKIKLNLLHEELKKVYSEVKQLSNTNDTNLFIFRNILTYIGTILLNNANMTNIRQMAYELMDVIYKEELNKDCDFLKRIRMRDFLDIIVNIITIYEKMIKLDFRLKNRQIIINNIKI